MLSMFVNKQLLVEGLNSLDNFEIVITKKFAVKEKIDMNMEEFKQKTCPNNSTNKTVVIIIIVVIVDLVLVLGVAIYNKIQKRKVVVPDPDDLNPDYGPDDYDDFNEVKDNNDYYFDDKTGDTAEITDANPY